MSVSHGAVGRLRVLVSLHRLRGIWRPCEELVEHQGLCVVVALEASDLIALQDVAHAFRFDALDADLRAEDGGEVRNALDDLSVGVAFLYHLNEAAVDLDDVEGNLLEDADRGETGAEVVEGDEDALGLEAGKDTLQEVDIEEAATLGDLEAEVSGREVEVFQDAQHHVHEVGLLELRVREVDVDDEIGVGPKDLLGGEHRFEDDPLAQFGEERVGLQDRNEIVGWHDAEAVVLPAKEGLRSDEPL